MGRYSYNMNAVVIELGRRELGRKIIMKS